MVPQNGGMNDAEKTTDDENATEEPSRPLWKIFERDVEAHARQLDKNATTEYNVTQTGRLSGTARQIDVLITGETGGEMFTIAIECKRYAKKIGIGKVDEFAGKLIDLGVDRGILYSFKGMTAPARARAAGASQPKISLGDLVGAVPKLPDWARLFPEFKFDVPSFGNCPSSTCVTGNIEWTDWPQSSGEVIEAGSCDTCGMWAVRCADCLETTIFFTETNPQKCDGCERKYQLQHGRDNTVESVAAS